MGVVASTHLPNEMKELLAKFATLIWVSFACVNFCPFFFITFGAFSAMSVFFCVSSHSSWHFN